MTSKIKVNTVTTESGSTLTLGESGKTVTLASGASQTGFGRTGTVDWQTGSIKTSTFTAANGEGYFANTSGGAFTMNLPAGSAGAIVSVVDYTNTFQTNNLTISPNGSEKIGGIAVDAKLATEGQSVTLVYVDDTEGWKNIQDSTSNVQGNEYIVATGGTITTCGNDKIHTFTGPGTFAVTCAAVCATNNTVSYLVIAGGGGSGYGEGTGAGGAGGFREVKNPVNPYTASPLDGYPSAPNRVIVTAASFPITVGGGGGSPASPVLGVKGSDSVFSTITSTGGGGGGGGGGEPLALGTGQPGGSGGGGGGRSNRSGGSGNTPPVSPAQGKNGGSSAPSCSPPSVDSGGGGGGATVAGTNGANCGPGGNGGAGATTSINGTPTARGGGGAGGSQSGSAGTAGPGGGGTGNSGSPSRNGTANTGGGGGGNTAAAGGSGGSGIVIIRYKFQ
jgi:hypothetical protein